MLSSKELDKIETMAPAINAMITEIRNCHNALDTIMDILSNEDIGNDRIARKLIAIIGKVRKTA